MRQVRRNVFETNSSSTHVLAIPTKEVKFEPIDLSWHTNISISEFGWEWGSANHISYLYTALCALDDQEKIKYFKNFLKKHVKLPEGVEFDFDKPQYKKYSSGRYLEYGYIDHIEDLEPLIERLFKDDDLLLRYITGAHIMLGTDNCTEDEADIRANFTKKYKKLGYEVYLKGN